MNKILITGASGFIGFHTAKELLKEGVSIIGIDNNLSNLYDNKLKHHRLDELNQNENFEFHKQDITDLKGLEVIFNKNKIIKIIHLAGRAGVRQSIEEPQDYVNSNILGTINLLELSAKYNIQNFVNISSSSIYAENEIPFREDNCISKINSPYGVTKRASELFAYSYHNIYKTNIVNLRFFTVYGQAARPDMSIFKFAKLIDNNEPIHIYGNGEQTRSFTFIDDIVNGIIKSLNIDGFETINLGNNKRYSLNYLISRIEKELNKKAKIIFKGKNNLDMQDTLPDLKNAFNLMKWKPLINLDEGISRTINWHKENRKLVNSLI